MTGTHQLCCRSDHLSMLVQRVRYRRRCRSARLQSIELAVERTSQVQPIGTLKLKHNTGGVKQTFAETAVGSPSAVGADTRGAEIGINTVGGATSTVVHGACVVLLAVCAVHGKRVKASLACTCSLEIGCAVTHRISPTPTIAHTGAGIELYNNVKIPSGERMKPPLTGRMWRQNHITNKHTQEARSLPANHIELIWQIHTLA